MKISVTIITFNEESKIGDAIRSVEWADEVLVVDSESTDRTRDIAASLGARVLINPWPGFSAQKQFAVDHASNDWILSLDADERISHGLKDEIATLGSDRPDADGYRIPRLSFYGGRAVRHGGWYPDLQLRLFDRRKGRWNGAVIHESVQMANDAVVGRLAGEILHYTIEGPKEHRRMITERYAPLGAEKMYREGRRSSPIKAVAAAGFSFIRGYVLRLGFLDGRPGFHIAYFAALNTYLKHKMLRELQNQGENVENEAGQHNH